jgi:hypothetical protein
MTETRKLAAILVADVVGYSRLFGADEEPPDRSPPVVPTFGFAPLRFQRLRLAQPRQLVKSG